MAKSELYDGPIFDVQAHAIMPAQYGIVAGAIRRESGLADQTKTTIIDDVLIKLADDLQGKPRLEALGSDNIQVVTVNTFFPPGLPPDTLLDVVEKINSWMAQAVAKNSQLIGTASIPPAPILAQAGTAPDGTSYAQKGTRLLTRAISEHHLQGVMLASTQDGVYLGDASFDPYFAVAEELNVPVIIHPPVQPIEAPYINRKNIPTITGFLNDQRTSLLDLCMSGVYEKYPNITIIATHLGGGILTSLGRIDDLSKRFPGEFWYTDKEGQKKVLPRPVDEYIKRIYFDCNNAQATDIVHAVSKVGVDHLLTGTDFPWLLDSITRATLGDLDEQLRSKIAYENAARLFKRC